MTVPKFSGLLTWEKGDGVIQDQEVRWTLGDGTEVIEQVGPDAIARASQQDGVVVAAGATLGGHVRSLNPTGGSDWVGETGTAPIPSPGAPKNVSLSFAPVEQ